MITNAKFAKHVKAITTPDGFTAEMIEETRFKPVMQVYVLKNDTIEIKFDQSGCGHTRFKVGEGWRTFDRLGVEDSFYHLPLWATHEIPPLNDIVAEQFERIAKSLAYHKTAVQIPDIPFTTSPEAVGKLKDELKTKGVIRFTPSGFGTGYEVLRKPRSYSCTRATAKLETFMGLSPLYVATFDAD